MDSESPVILVDLPYCYLSYDHAVRRQIRKIEFAEKKRQECRAAYTTCNTAAAGGEGAK